MNATNPDSDLPEVDIVIVTYRSAERAIACLDSLRDGGLHGLAPTSRVLVIDSGSGDGTSERVATAHPWVESIGLSENVGFATGCNHGIERSSSPAILLLNPDSIVPAGRLRPLVDHLWTSPRIAAVGPGLVGENGESQVNAQNFPSLATELSRQWERVARWSGRFVRDARPPQVAGPVDWVSGAAMLMRREAIDEIGSLDPGYFLYFEETDWCLRAAQSGWEVHLLPEVQLVHVGGASAEAADGVVRQGQLATVWSRSRRRYFTHHHGPLTACTVDVLHGARRLADRILAGGVR